MSGIEGAGFEDDLMLYAFLLDADPGACSLDALVQRKLDRVLDDQGVKTINTNGVFDPNLHEAVSHEESPDHEENQIIAELRKGYQIGNRVIRPALVRVAK